MRKLLVALRMGTAVLLLSSWLSAQDFKLETQQVKERQKQEMKALKLKHKFAKESMKGQDIAKSLRIQMEHEMEREEEMLRQKHKHELQELKDRQRVMKEL